MSDMRSEAMIDEQLDLITQYLNSQLDAKRAAEVRSRLENDREFLQLAAPLLLAWDAMRNGRPARAGEAEKRWDEFTRKADFEHHRKRRILRRNWLIGIVLAAITLPAFWFRADIRAQYRDWRDYTAVASDTGWITLRNHIQVRFDEGTRVLLARNATPNSHPAKLRGSAVFSVRPIDSTAFPPSTLPVVVHTAAGNVVGHLGDFSVTASGDTTTVEVLTPTRPMRIGFAELPDIVILGGPDMKTNVLMLRRGQRARLVRGAQPELIP